MKLSGPLGCSGAIISEALMAGKGVDGREVSGGSSESRVKHEFKVPQALKLQGRH